MHATADQLFDTPPRRSSHAKPPTSVLGGLVEPKSGVLASPTPNDDRGPEGMPRILRETKILGSRKIVCQDMVTGRQRELSEGKGPIGRHAALLVTCAKLLIIYSSIAAGKSAN